VISKLGKKTTRKQKNQRKGEHKTSKHIQPLDEKSQPIQWTEFPTGVLVGAGSCWPYMTTH
jgi:hypothetical protein